MHYTLQSGIKTEQITSRCPICLKVTVYQQEIALTDISVCCGEECYQQYYNQLIQLRDRALQWADRVGRNSLWVSKVILTFLEEGEY